jgi:glycosyltransferase involved in cell wall biosynthesis
VRVIPNGLDLQRFRPGQARAAGPVRIGMAARFTAIKRFDLLVGAMAELKRHHPQRVLELSLAGHGETLEAVRAQATAAGLADRVRFEGMLGDDALADWMRGLDIYAHASAGETLSLALLQAMATERPIVASDVAGIDTLLGPLRSPAVRLVPEPSAGAFAAAIREIADTLVSAQPSARLLRRECEQRFSIGRTFARYREVVESVRAERSAGRRRGISAGSGGEGEGSS